ncbi:MAG: hypothetical protein AAFN93_11090, partial [Bacteroidota bacterium]
YSHERNASKRSEWVYWADLPLIPNKSARKRIVFLGESVARGMFYDPFYNPAKALQKMVGEESFEVLDLAKTNMDLGELTTITEQSLQLLPDSLVIFAGNNWYNDVKRSFTKEDYEQMSSALENDDIPSFDRFIHGRYSNLVKDYIALLGEIKKKVGIPIIFIIPEFNLIDWKSSQNERIPRYLPSQQMSRWIALVETVTLTSDASKLEIIANELIEIDGTHPYGYELLAQAKMGVDPEYAKSLLEKARDTNIYSRCFSKPRVHSIIQNIFFEQAANHGVEIVDSRSLFLSASDGSLPDRKYFLDYCHLTEEGIKVTMAEAGEKLLKALNKSFEPGQLYNAENNLTDEARANAFINASIHNAHYGQSHDILQYLCTQALSYSEKSEEFMANYVDLATRKTSTTICKSHIHLVENEYTLQYGSTGIMQRNDQKTLDVGLVDAMIYALKQKNIDLAEDINQLRIEEHSPGSKPVDLLKSFYSSQSYDMYPGQKPAYYQSRNYKSSFTLVTKGDRDLRAGITLRTPFVTDTSEPITISINSEEIVSLKPSMSWTSVEFDINDELLKDGINEVIVRWPESQKNMFENKKFKDQALDDEEILHRLYTVFGEIHSFSIGLIESKRNK